MSTVTVRIPTPLRSYTSGADEVRVDAATVGEALTALGAMHEDVLPRILAENGQPRQFVNIYLGSENIRAARGMQTPVKDGDIVSIIPAVAGGSHESQGTSSLDELAIGAACGMQALLKADGDILAIIPAAIAGESHESQRTSP
jgi:molybdopterin converting factor small subunit